MKIIHLMKIKCLVLHILHIFYLFFYFIKMIQKNIVLNSTGTSCSWEILKSGKNNI